MTPQGAPHSASGSFSAHPGSAQSPIGPSSGGPRWGQDQAGFAGPNMGQAGYGQMPASAGGYNRPQASNPQWNQHNASAGGFGNVGNGFSGYQA